MLLTILGTRADEADYQLGYVRHRARLAPVALFDLLTPDERPDVIVALCTDEAKKATFPILEEAVSGKTSVVCQDVPSDIDEKSLDRFLDVMTGAAEQYPGSTVMIDVTHGWRHLSFLMYVGALYLAALGRVTVGRIYYALFAPSQGSQFFDLMPLLELPGWIHALETLRETGSARPIAAALQKHADSGPEARAIGDIMRRASDAHAAGLPIELGNAVDTYLSQKGKSLRKLLRDEHKLPLLAKVAEQLEGLLVPYRVASKKKDLALTEHELRRQALLVDDLLNRGNLPAALGLMNEWTVTWVLLKQGSTASWLDYHTCRRKAAGKLAASAVLR
ncbi:MAG: TM1812 family CRISPR-associated protein [Bryobacteraceae bacterium]|nr:TM1812 family CRISPR-associated protein [Bryobacteraceae bacterium]